MNLYGNLMDQILNSGAFGGLNSPKTVDRGIPEGMSPGRREQGPVAPGSSFMDQANQLSGVHPAPAPAPLPDLPGLGAGSGVPYVDEPDAVMPPPQSAPAIDYSGLLGQFGGMYGFGLPDFGMPAPSAPPQGVLGQAATQPQSAPQPAPQPMPQGVRGSLMSQLPHQPAPQPAAPQPAVQEPAPQPAQSPPQLPPEFLYGSPFMGLNGFRF